MRRMPLLRRPSKEPLWKDEFSGFPSDERYVTRRQFTKLLTLASLGMFVGNLWILAKAYFARTPSFPSVAVAEAGGTPRPGARAFCSTRRQRCWMPVRASAEAYPAYSQTGTQL